MTRIELVRDNGRRGHDICRHYVRDGEQRDEPTGRLTGKCLASESQGYRCSDSEVVKRETQGIVTDLVDWGMDL